MFPEETPFDEIGKRILEMGGGELLLWLAGLSPQEFEFVAWLLTELTIPGTVQRICDEIAHLLDLLLNGVPMAGMVEIQTKPDPDMFDRIGLAGHLFRLQHKPTDLSGDRWSLLGIVLNLTGIGNSSRNLRHAGSEWKIDIRECNLQELDGWETLEGIARGAVPKAVASFISLMQRGGEPAS